MSSLGVLSAAAEGISCVLCLRDILGFRTYLVNQENLTGPDTDSVPICSLWSSNLTPIVYCASAHLFQASYLGSGWVPLTHCSNLWKRWYVVKWLIKHLLVFLDNQLFAQLCSWMLDPVWCSQPSCLFGALGPAVMTLSWHESHPVGIFLSWWWAYEVHLYHCF